MYENPPPHYFWRITYTKDGRAGRREGRDRIHRMWGGDKESGKLRKRGSMGGRMEGRQPGKAEGKGSAMKEKNVMIAKMQYE